MRFPIRPTAAVLSALLCPACVSVERAELHMAYAEFDLDGQIGLGAQDGSAVGESSVDLQDDLGLDAGVGSPYASAEIQTSAGNINASGFLYDDTGRGRIDGSFGDLLGGEVDTEFDFRNLKAFYSYDVVETGPLRLAPGLGVDVIDTSTTVATLSAPSGFERLDVFAPVPMLFVEAELAWKPVSFEIEFGGSSLSLGDADGTFLDLEAQLVGSFLPFVDLYAGYRWLSIDADGVSEGQAFRADIDLSGWFVGGGVRF